MRYLSTAICVFLTSWSKVFALYIAFRYLVYRKSTVQDVYGKQVHCPIYISSEFVYFPARDAEMILLD